MTVNRKRHNQKDTVSRKRRRPKGGNAGHVEAALESRTDPAVSIAESEMEQQIKHLRKSGLRAVTIADLLNISPSTVRRLLKELPYCRFCAFNASQNRAQRAANRRAGL